MEKLINHDFVCNTYTVRNEVYEGQNHIVVPVVMMVEGVHSGSKGPLFHSIEELGAYPESWNGRPVTINHPQVDGVNTSANSPAILEAYAVGKIFNTHVDGTKLKAEVWINASRGARLSPEVMEAINQRQPLQVSTGAFTEEINQTGNWNEEEYIAIATNLRPDHLALLPGGVGACSLEDGCGINNNKKGGIMKRKEKGVSKELSFIVNIDDKEHQIDMKELIAQNLSVFPITNELSYQERNGTIQRKLDQLDTNTRVHYLKELYEDFFVYEVVIRDGEVADPLLYKRSYTELEDNSIDFTGEPQKVRREVNFIQVNTLIRTKGGKKMEKEIKPCYPDKVDALIANEATKFTADDKEWLLTHNEEQLEKLIPKEPEKKVVDNKEEKPTVETPIVNTEPKTTEAYLKDMPKEVRDQFETGLRLNADKRASLIKVILTNSEEGVWKEEELKLQDTGMLERIAKTTKAPVDYSALGSGSPEPIIVDNDQEEKLLPIILDERKEAK